MPRAKRKLSRRVRKAGVWEALNEPIAYPSDEFARMVFLIAALMLLAVWIAPYWNQSQTYADYTRTYAERVASAHLAIEPQIPEWYYTVKGAATDVVGEFGVAAEQVFDISGPVTQLVEFYEPGVNAVWNAWLELMQDPTF